MNTRDIKARKGEPVAEAWKRLVAWVESLHIVPDNEIDVLQTPHGTVVRLRHDRMWRHPFRVMAGGGEVYVTPGTVNGITPVISSPDGRRRIDNRDKDGNRLEKEHPKLKLDMKGGDKEGRLYICIKVKPTADGGVSGVVENKAGEQVSEEIEIVQTDSAKGKLDGHGYYPLAMLRLSKDRKSVEEVFQITHHNMRYAFQERNPSDGELKENPNAKKVGRHLFIPV
jgi:hypothetical protein